MRQAGILQNEEDARRFGDYLRTLDIAARIDPEVDHWAVWIREERDVTRSKEELSEFLRDPHAERYQQAQTAAAALRKAEARKAIETRRNFIPLGERWGAGGVRPRPLTLFMIGVSIFIALLTQLGKQPQGIQRYLSISRAALPLNQSGGAILPEVLGGGEIWRLVTPIFLHFSILHLAFNLYWLHVLGGMVESRQGTWRLALLTLVSAVVSNLAQYFAHGPHFGGLSGVGYALFGYVWMQSRFVPRSGLFIDPGTVFLMMLWLVLCMAGGMNGVANYAHGAGLAVGAAAGYLPAILARSR